MSTVYAPTHKIRFDDLFDGRLQAKNVYERIVPGDTTASARCLTDGRNWMWAKASPEGFLDTLVRSGPSAPRAILDAIEDVFETEIFSEYEPQFWGFDTQEEWDAFQSEIAEKREREFERELLKYLRGEPNNILPGSLADIQARIAQRLVAENPDLMLPDAVSRLLQAAKAESDARLSPR